jgi:glycosyltransferase involved in cell wall biosynthesis
MVEPTPGMRGPQRTLLTLAKYLAPRVALSVAIPEGFVSSAIRAEAPSVQVLEIPFHTSRISSWLGGARTLAAALGRGDGEVLMHANGLSALNLAAPIARRLNAHVLVHFHASEITARSRTFLRIWKRVGVKMSFLPVSDFGKGLLDAAGVGRHVRGILPNPIETTGFAAARSKPHQPFRVGFVGSKSPNKGLHRLVQTARLLRDSDVEWHIYGIQSQMSSTPYVERCRTDLEDLGDRVRWCGKVDDPEAAYGGIDALLMPSTRENMPRVVLEAMASGLPVVASDTGGTEEAVQHRSSGWLFDPRRPVEAADYLRELSSDPELWIGMSRAAVKAADRYDVATVGPILERHYHRVLRPSTLGV